MELSPIDNSAEVLGTPGKKSPPPVDDPAHEVSGGTVTAAVFGIVKAMVGPAILYLPHSFADAGYAFAVVALWICTALYLYTSQRLLQSWKYVVSQQTEGHLKYSRSSETIEIEMAALVESEEDSDSSVTKRRSKAPEDELEIFEDEDEQQQHSTHISYPQLAKLAYGDLGETIVQTGITLMQLGICLTYFIFVPHNISKSVWSLTQINLPLWICLLFMVLIEIPLSSIRNIRKLVNTNILATCLIAFGLASCLYLAIFVAPLEKEGLKGLIVDGEISNPDAFSKKHLSPWNDHWYLFIGTSVLLFEGSITLCIPLQEALQVPDSARRFPIVYNQTISSIVLFYTFFGLVCWKAFGSDVETVLTTSLPKGLLATVVQLAYSLAVIFTFPLQIFPALEIIVHGVEERRLLFQVDNDTAVTELLPWQRKIVCSIVIVLLSTIALIEMDNLGKVVSLMGSLLGCPLAFVFPPLIHSKIVPDPPRQADYAVAGLGCLSMVGATLITLATWSEPGER